MVYAENFNDDPYEKHETCDEIATVPPATVASVVESAHRYREGYQPTEDVPGE